MAKTLIAVRVGGDDLQAIDVWRDRQRPLEISRSDVVRLAISQFLKETGDFEQKPKKARAKAKSAEEAVLP